MLCGQYADPRNCRTASDHVTADELAQLLRLGTRCRTLILLLIHCGRLRALDALRSDNATAPGAARYRIA